MQMCTPAPYRLFFFALSYASCFLHLFVRSWKYFPIAKRLFAHPNKLPALLCGAAPLVHISFITWSWSQHTAPLTFFIPKILHSVLVAHISTQPSRIQLHQLFHISWKFFFLNLYSILYYFKFQFDSTLKSRHPYWKREMPHIIKGFHL